MQSPLWTLTDVTLRGTQRPRLRDVSVTIRSGITAIAGDSGAGKSSLLNLLVGFERPDAGRVVCHCTGDAGQLGVYWLPPGDGLWGHLTVRKHLETVRPPTADSGQMDQLLAAFDLHNRFQARPDDLSQGERARLAMARALASQAKVLVLDEPLVHTSLLRQPAYWQIVRDLCSHLEISLVFASHDLRSIAREADWLLVLDEGRLAYSGALENPSQPLGSSHAGELLHSILYHREEGLKTDTLAKQNRDSG